MDFILTLLQQFAGGPGPVENNLIRFGLAAVLWGILLVIAWSRQRSQELPREKLLVWGFGLFLAREMFMFSSIAIQVIGISDPSEENTLHHPIEDMLAMAAIVVVAGAFIRYVLDDARVSRRYLLIGLGVTLASFLIAIWTWSSFHAQNPTIHFHQSWHTWIFHGPLSILILVAIALLARKRSWLSNVVIVALAFFFISEFLPIINFATQNAYSSYLCPIGNAFHILAIPLLGFVYMREQSIEKEQAEEALSAYRDQLEDLVEERTAELSSVNVRLRLEVQERERAETNLVQSNAQLAALNAIAATTSQSLELETILNAALEMALSVLEMEVGAIFLLDPDTEALTIKTFHGEVPLDQLSDTVHAKYSCIGISYEALRMKQAILQNVSGCSEKELTAYIVNQGLLTIVSTPLLLKGISLGALTLGSTKTDIIGQSELDLLTAIGQQVGMAIENSRLYQDAERWAKDLTLIHQASIRLTSTLDADKIKDEIVLQAARLMDCQMAYILSSGKQSQVCQIVSSSGMDPSIEQFLVTHANACKLLQDLISKHRTIAITDARKDPRVPEAWKERFNIRSVLCLPVWVNEEPVEYLFLLDQRSSRRWRPEELKFIEAFINRAAVALENANLHKQLEKAAALEERQRIAANMHDGLAQTLSLLGLKIDEASELVENETNGDIIDELSDIRNTVGQASAEVRRSIASLAKSPPPRRGLQDQLCDLSNQIFQDGLPSVELITGDTQALFLSPDQSSQILPIIQEALLNTRRHARAQTIKIELARHADQAMLTIQDDGQGFNQDSSGLDDRDHFGLSIMRARARRIEADLRIESTSGEGTLVRLTWKPDRRYNDDHLDSDVQATALQTGLTKV
jgi:signal transduction histidine kinase